MAFLINCDNKGCHKLNEPQLDTNSNEVICSECGGIIKNISSFTKHQMKAMGQIVKNSAKQKPFAIKCEKCNNIDTPILKNNKLICSKCNAESKVTPTFDKLIKEHLKNK